MSKTSDKYRNWFNSDQLISDLMDQAADDIDERDSEIERLRGLLQNWMGCCFVDEKNGSVSFGMGVKKVWSETRSALQQKDT